MPPYPQKNRSDILIKLWRNPKRKRSFTIQTSAPSKLQKNIYIINLPAPSILEPKEGGYSIFTVQSIIGDKIVIYIARLLNTYQILSKIQKRIKQITKKKICLKNCDDIK